MKLDLKELRRVAELAKAKNDPANPMPAFENVWNDPDFALLMIEIAEVADVMRDNWYRSDMRPSDADFRLCERFDAAMDGKLLERKSK